VVIVVAAWMLDPAGCAGMAIGAPRVAISALVDLHHLLIERGFRRSCLDDPTIVQEERDEKPADTGTTTRGPRQLSMPFDSGRLRGISPSDRRTALTRLTRLLLEAAGGATEERDDDER
jgi:hypothetical protein